MFSKRKCSFFLGVAVLLSARPAGAQATGAKRPEAIAVQDDPNRDFLRLAKAPTDGPGLLRFLEKLGGKDEDLLRLDALIAQLGDAQFAKRTEAAQKIVALQHAAIAKLKAAEQSKDAEIKARAKDCLKAIYRNHRLGIPLTAIRVLAKDRPDGLAQALLHFLPYTAEEEVQEEVWFTLYDLVKADPRKLPLLEKSLQDPLAPRRALAGCVLGRLGSPAQQAAVQKLLADPDAHVRLRSAQGLLAGKNPAGVATLIALLEHPAVEISWSAEELLHYLAGDEAPPEKVGAASDKERLASRKAWETWWGKQEAKFDFKEVEKEYRRPALYLAISPEFNPPQPGIDDDPSIVPEMRLKRTEDSKGQIAVYGCDGKLRWHLRDWVNDALLLPGNRLLVVGHCPPPGIAVSEKDLRGKVLWNPKVGGLFPGEEPARIPKGLDVSFVDSSRRLLNGNTLIDMGSAGTFEIDRDGDLVHYAKAPEISKPIAKIDSRLVSIAKLGNYPGIRLRNGNAVAVRHFARIVEFSPDGRALWEAICQPYSIQFAPAGIHECLGLVKLGFDAPRPADLDVHTSIAYLTKRLRGKDQLVRRFAASDLGALGPKLAPAIPTLKDFLKSPEVEDVRLALSLLKAFGPQGYPYLLEGAKDKRIPVRLEAFRCLVEFVDQSETLVPLWFAALKDMSPVVRVAALDALWQNLALRVDGKGKITEAERKRVVVRIADALSDIEDIGVPGTEYEPRVCDGAVHCLKNLRSNAHYAIPSLRRVLSEKDLRKRRDAVHCLGMIGADASIAIPDLVRMFDADDVQDQTVKAGIQANIIGAFGAIGPSAKPATGLIVRVLRDKSFTADMRVFAVDALQKIGYLNDDIEQALNEAAASKTQPLSESAKRALRQLRLDSMR